MYPLHQQWTQMGGLSVQKIGNLSPQEGGDPIMQQCERCKQGAVTRVISLPDGSECIMLCAPCFASTFLIRYIVVPANTCSWCGKPQDDHPTLVCSRGV